MIGVGDEVVAAAAVVDVAVVEAALLVTLVSIDVVFMSYD